MSSVFSDRMASERGEGGRTALVVEGTGQAWSIEEVGRHSTDRSNWLVVHGRVYDVTTFISKVRGAHCARAHDHIRSRPIYDVLGTFIIMQTHNSTTIKK